MKNKTKIFSIVLFLSVSIMPVSSGGQKAEWKGTIEKENGVIIVKNPKEPMYGEDVFSPEGKFIAKIPISHEVLMGRQIIFKGGNLYLIEADEDGYQYVKRYKVTWRY